MKNFKRFISISVALALLVASVVTAVSFSAVADDTTEEEPVVFMNFSKSNFAGYGSYAYGEDGWSGSKGSKADYTERAKTLQYGEDGSLEFLSRDYKTLGVRMIYNLDSSAKAMWPEMQEIADAKYQENLAAAKAEAEKAGKKFDESTVAKVAPGFNVSATISTALRQDSESKNLYMSDTQLRFYVIMDDGTKIQLSTIAYMDMYQSENYTVEFKYGVYDADTDSTTTEYIENLDNVKQIMFEVYHWTKSQKGVYLGALTVSGYGTHKTLPEVTAGDETTAVAVNWDKNYKKDYGNEPAQIKYSSTAEGPYKGSGVGWLRYDYKDTGGAQQQNQTFYSFDKDQFEKALAIANKKDEDGNLIGSGKFLITVTLESVLDTDGNEVQAQVDLMAATYSKGYVRLVKKWQNSGTSVEYELDVSQFDPYDVYAFRPAIQNYWYYDKDGKMVQYPTWGNTVKDEWSDEDLTDNNGATYTKIGTGVTIIPILVKANISPITVMEKDHVATTAVVTTTKAAETKANLEGVGYHYFDYADDCRLKDYGNNPEKFVYLTDGDYKGGVKIISGKYDKDTSVGSWTKKGIDYAINKQFQGCWSIETDTYAEHPTVISDEVKLRVQNRMKQALAYANAPGALGMLAFKTKVYSAVHAATDEDCSVECSVMLHGYSSENTMRVNRYVNIDQETTLYFDVSELEYDSIYQVHPMGMNYASVDPKTGEACGFYNVEVDFSALYVAGPDDDGAPARTEKPTADNSEISALMALYRQLPGLSISDYTSDADWALLEKFFAAYTAASPQTVLAFEDEIGIDNLLALLDLQFASGYSTDDNPDTGAASVPIATALAAVAAGFVIIKSRKK